jgi:hypothetical protein
LGAFFAVVVVVLHREELPSELGVVLLAPFSALIAGLTAATQLWLAGRFSGVFRKRWWGLVAAVFLLGLGGFLVLDVVFVERVPTRSGGDIAVILAGARAPGCPCGPSLDDMGCAEQLYFERPRLDRCWPGRWRVRLALSGSFLLALAGLGGVTGLFFTPARIAAGPRWEPPPVVPPHLAGYLDFHLRLDRSEGGKYRALARDSEGREVSEVVDLAPLLGQPEHFPLHFAAVSPEGEGPPEKRFGAGLFEAVFDGELRGALRASQESAAAGEGRPLRLRINLQEVPELADLPWEYLYDRRGEGFLALSRDTPLVRCLESLERLEPLAVRPPLRVLVMISTPADYGSLDAAAEWDRIRRAVEPLEHQGLVELERLPDGRYGTLVRRLRRRGGKGGGGSVHIFHFIGHGGFHETRQEGVLVFENEQGRGEPTGVEALAEALAAHHSVRLAVLNSCAGARASRRDAFAGAAQTLLQRGVPAVVAMQSEVTDETARTFSEWLYGALADGYPVDAAVGEVRNLLSGRGNPEWGTPVLYLRASDARLFDLGERGPEAGPERWRERLEAEVGEG